MLAVWIMSYAFTFLLGAISLIALALHLHDKKVKRQAKEAETYRQRQNSIEPIPTPQDNPFVS